MSSFLNAEDLYLGILETEPCVALDMLHEGYITKGNVYDIMEDFPTDKLKELEETLATDEEYIDLANRARSILESRVTSFKGYREEEKTLYFF